MRLDTSSLELLARIARLGAIGEAGRDLGLSPTVATQRVQALEADLGVKLLNRTTRSVSLTPDGEAFLVYARRILSNVEDAQAELSSGRGVVKGQIRVTASASFGRRHIAPYLADFLAQYPDMRVRLELNDGIIDIVDHGIDVAFRIGTLASSSLVARKLAENPRFLVAAPAYLERFGAPARPADLKTHNCVLLGENRVWRLRGSDGRRHEVRVSGNLVTNHGEAITEAVLAGAGVALKSLWDVHAPLRDGRLVPVLDAFAVEPSWSIWAVRPPGDAVPPRVRVFIDFMRQRFKRLERFDHARFGVGDA